MLGWGWRRPMVRGGVARADRIGKDSEHSRAPGGSSRILAEKQGGRWPGGEEIAGECGGRLPMRKLRSRGEARGTGEVVGIGGRKRSSHQYKLDLGHSSQSLPPRLTLAAPPQLHGPFLPPAHTRPRPSQSTSITRPSHTRYRTLTSNYVVVIRLQTDLLLRFTSESGRSGLTSSGVLRPRVGGGVWTEVLAQSLSGFQWCCTINSHFNRAS
jgi:hypothetical protein